jgi:hypothetical protein
VNYSYYIDQSETISNIITAFLDQRHRRVICGLKDDQRTIIELQMPVYGNIYSSAYRIDATYSAPENIVDMVVGGHFSTSYVYEMKSNDSGPNIPRYGATSVSPHIGLKADGKVINWMRAKGSYWNSRYNLSYPAAGIPEEVNCTCASCGPIVDIAGSRAFLIALKGNGGVVAWRYKTIPNPNAGRYGQFSHYAEPELLSVPQEVISGVIAIQANYTSNYAMALKVDGSVVVWDVNGNLLPVPEGLNLSTSPGTNPDTVGQWGLDSVKNSIAYDTGGQNNNGIISGATLTTGIISNALQFDGVDDKVTFSYSKPENNFTLEAWVKPTEPHQIDTQSNSGTAGTAGQKYIFGANQEGANGGIGVSVGTNGISVYEHGDGYMPALAVYNGAIGTDWVHIVVVVENQTPKIYLNGQLVRTGVKSTRPKSIAPTILGYGPYGAFKGNIDEVALYQKALTAQEIKQAYEKVVFLENITITNKDNNETTAQCTFGSHLNKIEFNLKKKVTQLNLVLDLPSNIKIGQILKITRDNVNIPTSAATITGGNQITINQELQTGHYKIEFLITINEQLIVKTKAYSDEKKVFTNTESGIFELRFMDFGSLPNVT